ncbi:MAG TPA: DNA replication/repair protein RecF [Gammaproteobacteria bacterium]|nr:DNA replication/repair protein RecF [Gammaproteobacteria bacterium]
MSLLRLDLADFRNFELVKIDSLANGFNFFYGQNASGKTSLLEAIYYLSRGKSFRSSSASHIIHHSAEKFSIFAHLQAKSQQMVPVGVERQRNGDTRVRILGEDSHSFTELVELIPSLLINSSSFSLLDAGPIFRRKYLDWCAFYLLNDFLRIWKMHERALKQRNAALREHQSKKEIDAWTHELVKCAMDLDELRRDVVAQLMPFLQSALAELIEVPDLDLSYYPGWDETQSYQQAMSQFASKDLYAGYTQLGPHRADFKISIGKTPVKDILSRGQQKLFICAMIVAQGAMLQKCVNRRSIYLIDDLPSELDSQSRSHLMELLARQNAQVFVTAVEREALAGSCRIPMKMFHVEHSSVKEEKLTRIAGVMNSE